MRGQRTEHGRKAENPGGGGVEDRGSEKRGKGTEEDDAAEGEELKKDFRSEE